MLWNLDYRRVHEFFFPVSRAQKLKIWIRGIPTANPMLYGKTVQNQSSTLELKKKTFFVFTASNTDDSLKIEYLTVISGCRSGDCWF